MPKNRNQQNRNQKLFFMHIVCFMLLSRNNERSMHRYVLGVIARGQWPDWMKKICSLPSCACKFSR